MQFISKHKKEIIFALLIILLYFVLRLPNLTLQPIFADEGIYIRWAQVMRAEPTLRFLPLSDGKTPFFMWSMMPFLKVFSFDPLWAGRFLSVMAGFASLIGVFVLSRRVFGSRVAFFSAFIYTIVPYSVFFDRMALVDSMLAAFSVWSLYLAVWLLKSPRLDLAMILGFLLGGGMLTKTPGIVNILSLPVVIFGFDYKKFDRFIFLKIIFFGVVSVLIAFFLYNLLRLGPNFHMLSSRNSDYVFSLKELSGRPLDPFIPHVRDILDWFPKLITWPILGLLAIGLWFIIRNKNKLGWIILLWALIPLLVQTALLKTFTARYLFLSIPPLLILAGLGMEKVFSNIRAYELKLLKIIVLILLILPAFYFDYFLLTNPSHAPLPKEERKGYLEDWTAGYGFKEIANYLINQKKNGPVVVGTEGYFGTLPDGLQIYLDKANIAIVPDKATISANLRESTKENQVFFVANKARIVQNLKGVELIKEYPKATSSYGEVQDAIVFYRVLKEK